MAIIADGNRRWARERGLPVLAGHIQGIEAIRPIVRRARDAGVQTLSVYTFSTENWARPEDEVSGLFGLIDGAVRQYTDELVDDLFLADRAGDRRDLDVRGPLPDEVVSVEPAHALDADAAVIRMPDERNETLVPRAVHVADARAREVVVGLVARPQPMKAPLAAGTRHGRAAACRPNASSMVPVPTLTRLARRRLFL